MWQIQERYSGDILSHLDSRVQPELELGKIFAILPPAPNSPEAASCIRDVLTYFLSFCDLLEFREMRGGGQEFPGVRRS